MEENHNPFRLIKSSRGGFKLAENGFFYDKQRKVGDVVHWQCEQRSICKARIFTKDSDIVRRCNEHLHGPDEEIITGYETKSGIKRRAEVTQDCTHQIVGESLLTVSEGTAAKLPKLNSLKRSIQRQRQRVLAAPTQPPSLFELEIPMDYRSTAKGEMFLLYDSGPESERILIFGTGKNIDMLKCSQHWLADGTFKTAPILFQQVYVIHALRGGPNPLLDGHLLPSLFILLPNKTQVTYTRMWEQVNLICPHAQPLCMLMDFEKAAINSFQQVWQNTEVKGCFFHLTQNVWRKVQGIGLQAQYIQDPELAMRIRLLPALAFAAPNEVPDLLTLVAQQLPMPEASELIHYFEKTYVGRFLPGGTFQAPLFPISMWNYYHETPFGLPRTNNAVEAWHRSFNASVGCQHPNIWRFITSLKREQGLVEFRQAKFTAGARPTKRRKEQNTDRALKELVQSFYYRPRLEFLRGVAHQFNLQT